MSQENALLKKLSNVVEKYEIGVNRMGQNNSLFLQCGIDKVGVITASSKARVSCQDSGLHLILSVILLDFEGGIIHSFTVFPGAHHHHCFSQAIRRVGQNHRLHPT